jgi:hypothetical protein
LINTPRNTACLSDTHLIEREQLRRIRRNRLPGEPSGIPLVLTRRPDEFLQALRALGERLARDGDSHLTWNGLSLVFEAMDDRTRSERCRDIARCLSRPLLAKAQARG